MTDADLLRRAVHEAGHVVLHRLYHHEILATSLNDGGDFGGAIWTRCCGDSVDGLRGQIVCLLGGGIAERRVFPNSRGDDDDRQRAAGIARRLAGELATRGKINRELGRGRTAAEKLVDDHWPKIRELAGRLINLHTYVEGIGAA
jgi:hypothetical protein